MNSRELAPGAGYCGAFGRDLLAQRVRAVEVGKRALKQKLALGTVASMPDKLVPERLRTLGKMARRLGNRARYASFHVFRGAFGFCSRCERNPEPVVDAPAAEI